MRSSGVSGTPTTCSRFEPVQACRCNTAAANSCSSVSQSAGSVRGITTNLLAPASTIEAGDALCQQDRVASGDDENAGTELESFGASRSPCHGHYGVERRARNAFGEPDAVEAVLFEPIDKWAQA